MQIWIFFTFINIIEIIFFLNIYTSLFFPINHINKAFFENRRIKIYLSIFKSNIIKHFINIFIIFTITINWIFIIFFINIISTIIIIFAIIFVNINWVIIIIYVICIIINIFCKRNIIIRPSYSTWKARKGTLTRNVKGLHLFF
jgi:hypothetical protein